jgi:hypothetical protein
LFWSKTSVTSDQRELPPLVKRMDLSGVESSPIITLFSRVPRF